ncbi:MAG: nuoN [Ilumatobacteraceae bacterium]|nr:nuoN [Ilumatobacteraceae bacterium]
MAAILAADSLRGPSIDWLGLSPLLILLGAAMVLLVVAVLTPTWPRGLYAWFTVAASAATIVLAFVQWHRIDLHGTKTLVGGAIAFDHFAVWMTITIAVAILLVALSTDGYLRREGLDGPELYALYMLCAVGGIVMSAANDLIVLFLGLEILSIALYVMAASHRKRVESQEAGIKYFVLGGFSSAFFLYGVALIYGSAGSTNFSKIIASFGSTVSLDRHDGLVLAGVAMLIVGLGFKTSSAPFHFWAPDVYQGSPTPVSGFMASAGKAAAFAALLRVLIAALPYWRDDYRPVIWALAVLTLVVGATMAVIQTNVKRMLAFSSINHAGFMLVGVEAAAHVAGNPSAGRGMSSVLLYLLLYSVLVTGTFAIVAVVSRTGDNATDLAAFRGLGRSRPTLAIALTVLLLSQAGVPLTSGFIAKFGVIQAAVDERSYALAIIAMVTAVIAAFLYLRIMVSVWVQDPEAGDDAREPVRVPWTGGLAIALSVGFTIVVGVAPGWLVDLSNSVTNLAH